jgi:hypothetical protein
LVSSSGCGDPRQEPDWGALRAGQAGPATTGCAITEHDLGVVLADGQTIRHEFALKNTSERSITSTPLGASFLGTALTRDAPGGLVEATRELEVLIPPGRTPGARRGELVLSWRDGRTETQIINWEVRPHLTVSPRTIVLEAGVQHVRRRVVVASDCGPFIVKRVFGSLVRGTAPLPRIARVTHQLNIEFDAPAAAASRTVDVLIETDHPDQPAVSLGIIVLPNARKAAS